MVLELVIRRVLELKHELVKWNPPNVDVRFPPPAPEQAFPWDYVNLDDILVDLKLSPDTLDIAVPRQESVGIMSATKRKAGRGGRHRWKDKADADRLAGRQRSRRAQKIGRER